MNPGTPSAYIDTALFLPTNTECPLKSATMSQYGRRWGSYLKTNISSCSTWQRPPPGSCKITVQAAFLQIWYMLPSHNTRLLALMKFEIVLDDGSKLVEVSNSRLLPTDDNNVSIVGDVFRSGHVPCIWTIRLLCTTRCANVWPSRMIGSRRRRCCGRRSTWTSPHQVR